MRGFVVATGRAYPVETGVPYAVFSDVLLPILRAVEPSLLTLLTRGGTAELAQLFPALEVPREASGAGRGDPAELKARLLWNFAQFLARFAAKRPLVLILENLQWADSASLEMLHFVARQVGASRVLIIGTHNDPEHRTNAALRATEQSLKRLENLQRIRLEPLDTDAVVELLEKMFDADASRTRAFAERLQRWTRGNPFFIDETIRALVEAGELRETNGAWSGWDVDELRVPPTIRETVLARLAELSPTARRLADIAAVLGNRATHDELEAVSGLGHDPLISAVDELRAADVLGEHEDGSEIVYDFSHPLIQEILYTELGLARTRTLHGAVAESLESLYGADAMAHAGELAFHYSRGEARKLASKAVRYLRAAGRDASAKYANREAADYLGAALTIADSDRSTDDELITELARVRQRVGDYAGALALWERALDAAHASGDMARVAPIERSIGLAKYWGGAVEDALQHYDAAITAARASDDRRLESRVLIAKASALQAIGRTAESRGEIERALEIAIGARRCGAASARAHAAPWCCSTSGPDRRRRRANMARAPWISRRRLANGISRGPRIGRLRCSGD